jgi:5-methylthioadenosine/S-adenosylhomocysteine deaminase
MKTTALSHEPLPYRVLARALTAGYLLAVGLLNGAAQMAEARERVDLIVAGGTVVTMDTARHVIERGAIAVRGDTVVAVGLRSIIDQRYTSEHRIDASDGLILPGLINGHTHAPMTLFRGIADDASLQDWLQKYIFPAEARNVTPDFVTWGTRLACLEMIRSGVTTFADMYYFEDDIARAAKACGMRGILGETMIGFPAPDNKTEEQAFRYTERFLNHWQGDPLIDAAIAPHSIYTCSANLLERSARLARQHQVPILIHLAESQRERNESLARHGLTPVAYLDKLGFLGPDVTAAHCIWVDADDTAILVRRQVGCVHNPSSNMQLASGVAPVPLMLASGVRLGLGTDGSAGGNHDLDLMEELSLSTQLQKVTRDDPRALNAEQALEMATIGGASALHMERRIGSLEPGKKADLIVLDLGNSDGIPMYNVYSQVVYSLRARDVRTVVIGGRAVMENRHIVTLDEGQVLERARDYTAAIRRSLPIAR